MWNSKGNFLHELMDTDLESLNEPFCKQSFLINSDSDFFSFAISLGRLLEQCTNSMKLQKKECAGTVLWNGSHPGLHLTGLMMPL